MPTIEPPARLHGCYLRCAHPSRLHCGLEDSFDEFYIAIGYAVALKTDMCAAYEEWGEA